MKNQVIKCINPEQGKRILKYFRDLGVDTKSYLGVNYEGDGRRYIYYGVINRTFSNYPLSIVEKENAEIIDPFSKIEML